MQRIRKSGLHHLSQTALFSGAWAPWAPFLAQSILGRQQLDCSAKVWTWALARAQKSPGAKPAALGCLESICLAAEGGTYGRYPGLDALARPPRQGRRTAPEATATVDFRQNPCHYL